MDRKNLFPYMLLAVLSLGYTTSAQDCPSKCECTEGNTLVQCTELTAFPAEIPASAKQIEFDKCVFDNITKVPSYTGVITLIILHSGVRDISDGAFDQLSELTTLIITGNHLQHLRPGMFMGLTKVTKLELEHNDIHKLEENVFQEMSLLETLSLASNTKLILMENSFNGYNYLKHLTLDKCGLNNTKIHPKIFQKAQSLQRLDLGHNPIGSLGEDAFEGLENLLQLNLPSCYISSIDESAFDDLEKLTRLNLAYNKIKSLDKHTFHEFEDTLVELYIEHNQLETLHHDAVPYKRLTNFGLEGNPWKCDCGIFWMKSVQFMSSENVTCSSPAEVSGQDVQNVTSNLICPCDEGFCDDDKKLALYIIIPILIVCAVLICFFVFKIIQNRKKAKHNKSVRYSEVYRDTTETKS